MKPLLTFSFLTLLPPALGGPVPPVKRRDTRIGCTKASFGNFSWTVDSFDFHASYIFTTPAHQNSWGYANFTLANPALPSAAAVCSATSSRLDDFFYGDLWYTCAVPNGSAAGNSAGAAFAFNRASGRLDFDQTWSCSDADAQFPYVLLLPCVASAFVKSAS